MQAKVIGYLLMVDGTIDDGFEELFKTERAAKQAIEDEGDTLDESVKFTIHPVLAPIAVGQYRPGMNWAAPSSKKKGNRK